MNLTALALPLLLAAPGSSEVPGPGAAADPAGAFCSYAEGVADSETARLVAPDLIAGAGWVYVDETVWGGGMVTTLMPRVFAGLSYSFAHLWRGLASHDLGRARCARYRVISELQSFLESGSKAISRRALSKKLRALEDALPQALVRLKATEESVKVRSATYSELVATQLRVDALRELAHEVQVELAAIPSSATPPSRSLPSVLERRGSLEERVAELEADLRESWAWDVQIRGGYENVIGAPQPVPLFGVLNVSFSLGWPWEKAANGRAVEAWRGFAEQEAEGASERARHVLERLRATLKAERARLGETGVLVGDLQARYDALDGLPVERVARYRDLVWFELVKVQAEQAYLQAHVSDLADLLADGAADR